MFGVMRINNILFQCIDFLKEFSNTSKGIQAKQVFKTFWIDVKSHIDFFLSCKMLVNIYHSCTYSQSVSLSLGFPAVFQCPADIPFLVVRKSLVQCRTGHARMPSCFSTLTQCPAFSDNLFLSGSALQKPRRDLFFLISFEIRKSTILYWFSLHSVLNYPREWSFHASVLQTKLKWVTRAAGSKRH